VNVESIVDLDRNKINRLKLLSLFVISK